MESRDTPTPQASGDPPPHPPIGQWVDKLWGRARWLHVDERSEVMEIEARAGGKSSVHKHWRKDNLFLVLEGRLEVIVYTPALAPPPALDRKAVVIDPYSNPLLVCAGDLHQFRAIADVLAIEVYRQPGGGRGDMTKLAGEGDIVRQ